MNAFQRLRRLLNAATAPQIGAERMVVPTHCLYPSNSMVSVIIEGGNEEFTVSDDGRAFDEANISELTLELAEKLVRPLVLEQGLKLAGGIIYAHRVPLESVPAAVMLVANASKEAVHYLHDKFKIKRRRPFLVELAELLDMRFHGRVIHKLEIIGASNKPHRFEHVIQLPNDRKLIVDPVLNEASSINARVVANIDVKQARHRDIEQRLVYDEKEPWRAEDLQLLTVGATTVPFERLAETLDRLAA